MWMANICALLSIFKDTTPRDNSRFPPERPAWSEQFPLCFLRPGRYNRPPKPTPSGTTDVMKRLAIMLFAALLLAGLQQCGQKGGLTRPEPNGFSQAGA